MKWRPRSVRVRLTLWFVAVLALIILAFSATVYLFVQARLVRQVNRELSHDLEVVADAIREEPDEPLEIEEYGIGLVRIVDGAQNVHQTEDWREAGLDKSVKRDGKETKGAETKEEAKPKEGQTEKRNRAAEKSERPEKAQEKDIKKKEREDDPPKARRPWTWKSRAGKTYRLMTGQLKAGGQTFQITVARDMKPVHQSLKTLVIMLLTGFPCGLILALAGGYFLTGRLLSPVGSMAAKAREITAEKLSERLPVENPDDEFGQLATVFNDTLARLEGSFDRLRRFTADASHELRTPLTAIRSVGEVALQENLDAAACRDVIGSMLEETDRLARLVDSLLILTRADFRTIRLNREPLELEPLIRDVADFLGVLAEEKGQTLGVEIAEPLTVEADRATVRQALVNLLDNAIKHTPAGGHIRLVLKKTDGGAAIEVCDEGPGIPPEHREKIFERFYRIEKDRSSETGGAGLGLAIARWAIEANNGRIELESEPGRGSTFRMILPERKAGGAA